MARYRVNVSWTVSASHEIEADSWDEACDKARELSPPDNGVFVEGSYFVDSEDGTHEEEQECQS